MPCKIKLSDWACSEILESLLNRLMQIGFQFNWTRYRCWQSDLLVYLPPQKDQQAFESSSKEDITQ